MLQENPHVKAMKQKENLLQNMEQDLRVEIRWRKKLKSGYCGDENS